MINKRNDFKLVRFIKFNNSNKLERVDITKSFTVLVFSNSTVILTKHTFEIVKQVKGFFEKIVESNYSLFMSSKKLKYLQRFCFLTQTETKYELPSNQKLTNFTVCSENKFLIGIAKHLNSARNSSLVFWVANNPKFLFHYDFKKIIRNVKILNESQLAIYSKHVFKVFDTNTLKETMTLKFDKEIKKMFIKSHNALFLQFSDQSFRKILVDSQQEKKIKKFGQNSILIFLEQYVKFYEMQDIYSMIHIAN